MASDIAKVEDVERDHHRSLREQVIEGDGLLERASQDEAGCPVTDSQGFLRHAGHIFSVCEPSPSSWAPESRVAEDLCGFIVIGITHCIGSAIGWCIPPAAIGQERMASSTKTAGQTATSAIRDRILAGDLAPGAKLAQHRLATELGMSRIPVRDALRSLAAEGLVEVRDNSTAVVASLSMQDLQELYEIRISLEPRLGLLAIPNLTSHHFAEMDDLLDRMESVHETAAWLPLNNRFHETLYSAAKRDRSLHIIRLIRRQTDRYTAVYVQLNHEMVDAEHRMILEAARNGQPTRIEALLTAHISSSYEEMLRYLTNEGRVAGTENTRAPAR